MASILFDKKLAVAEILEQMSNACSMLLEWSKNIHSADDYVSSPSGMEKLAAACMLVESIGEGIKKIDKLAPGFLLEYEPDVPWKDIKGMRDHIAHGYFNIDAGFVFDVVSNEIGPLKRCFIRLRNRIRVENE